MLKFINTIAMGIGYIFLCGLLFIFILRIIDSLLKKIYKLTHPDRCYCTNSNTEDDMDLEEENFNLEDDLDI